MRRKVMGTETMGRVTVAAMIENLDDAMRAERGELPIDQLRRLNVANALVDTGATNLSLPSSLIQKLGLTLHRRRQSMTAAGPRELAVYNPVRLTIQDRDCVAEVTDLPEGCPVLIGQLPLEAMDWVVDTKGQRLIGNPAHGGEWTIEQY
jgi:predicted aspartyl protease